MLGITTSAAEKFKQLLRENGREDHGVRLYLSPGG